MSKLCHLIFFGYLIELKYYTTSYKSTKKAKGTVIILKEKSVFNKLTD